MHSGSKQRSSETEYQALVGFGLARASAYEEIWRGSPKIRRPVAAI
jgi:hypothetical protein